MMPCFNATTDRLDIVVVRHRRLFLRRRSDTHIELDRRRAAPTSLYIDTTEESQLLDWSQVWWRRRIFDVTLSIFYWRASNSVALLEPLAVTLYHFYSHDDSDNYRQISVMVQHFLFWRSHTPHRWCENFDVESTKVQNLFKISVFHSLSPRWDWSSNET